MPKVLETIVLGVELPRDVFNRRYAQYLFFDADISTSKPLIAAIRQAATACFGSDVDADVYASSSRSFLMRLGGDLDWPLEINALHKAMLKDGDVYGLVVVDSENRWAVYQPSPVDVGVLAIDCLQDLMNIEVVKASFFSLDDIKGWLSYQTPGDHDLVDSFGEGFLTALLGDYS
ncbi:hypothetical protein ABIF86_005908 [Bradyrhizobium japonicum]